MEPVDNQNLGTTYQVLSWVGAGLAGALMWVFGRRRPGDSEEDKVADLMRKLDRAETASDINKMREDMQRVLGAMREAILNKLEQVELDLSKRISAVERSVDRLENRSPPS